MNFGPRFLGFACLVMITIASLANGGAFKPDNVIGVDTVTVVETVTIPKIIEQHWYPASENKCGTLELDDGRSFLVSHVRVGGWMNRRLYKASELFDGIHRKWHSYRACQGGIVRLQGNPKGYYWRPLG